MMISRPYNLTDMTIAGVLISSHCREMNGMAYRFQYKEYTSWDGKEIVLLIADKWFGGEWNRVHTYRFVDDVRF